MPRLKDKPVKINGRDVPNPGLKWNHVLSRLALIPICVLVSFHLVRYLQYPTIELRSLNAAMAGIQSVLKQDYSEDFLTGNRSSEAQVITIALVACGSKDRFGEVSVILKSLLLFSTSPFQLVVFTDSLRSEISELLEPIRTQKPRQFVDFTYEIKEPNYPVSVENQEIKNTFQMCASLRLFLPDLLPHVDKILYLDTDIVLLDSLDNIWNQFHIMNASQMAAMAHENQVEILNVYSYANYPTVKLGFNSGVMLMDLEKMRRSFWIDKNLAIYKHLSEHLIFGDQDIINIYAHYYPESIHVLPCTMNFRPDLCLRPDVSCPEVRSGDRVMLLHGNRRAFMEQWQFGGSLFTYLLQVVRWYLKNANIIPYSIRVIPTVYQQNVYQAVQRTFNQIDLRNPNVKKDVEQLFLQGLSSYSNLEGDICAGIVGSLKTSFKDNYALS